MISLHSSEQTQQLPDCDNLLYRYYSLRLCCATQGLCKNIHSLVIVDG